MNRSHHYSPFPSIIAGLICLFAGLVIGYFARKPSIPTSSLPAPPLPPEASSPAARAQGRSVPGNTLAPNPSSLERLRTLLTSSGDIDLFECLDLIRDLSLPDCKSALSFLRESRWFAHREPIVDAFARHWARLDPADALATAIRERQHDVGRRMGPIAGAALAARNAEGALQLIAAQTGNQRLEVAEWILQPLSKIDPARAAKYLSENPFLRRHPELYMQIGYAYGSVTPEAALRWVESIPNSSLRDSVSSMVWRGWAESAPSAVVAAMAANPDLKVREDIYGSIARSWGHSDPSAAIAWIESIPNTGNRMNAYRSLHLDTKKLGSDAARALIDSVRSEDIRSHLIRQAAADLARENVSDALSLAENLPEGNERTQALAPVLNEWSRNDPMEAVRYIMNLPESRDRSAIFQQAMNFWTQSDPDSALAYVQQLSPGRERDMAAGEIVKNMRDENPQKALEWMKTIQDPSVMAPIAEDMVGSLVRNDREQAISIASQLPSEAQPKAYYGLIRGWAFEQTQAAGDWINSLPSGAGRDSAIEAYVSVIDGMDAGLATKWANTIEEPKARTKNTMDAFQRWSQNDPAAARAWLNETTLAEGLRPFFEEELEKAEARPRFE